jgi:hypothetical protein
VQFYIVVFYYYFPHIAPQKSIQATPTVHDRAQVFLNSYFKIQDVFVHHDLNKNLKITRWGVKNINKFLVHTVAEILTSNSVGTQLFFLGCNQGNIGGSNFITKKKICLVLPEKEISNHRN